MATYRFDIQPQPSDEASSGKIDASTLEAIRLAAWTLLPKLAAGIPFSEEGQDLICTVRNTSGVPVLRATFSMHQQILD